MNKFTSVKGDIGAESYYSLDYAPTSTVRLSTIHVSAKQPAEFDVYFGKDGGALSHIFWMNTNSASPNYTLHFPRPLLMSENNYLRVVLINKHTATQTLSATIGIIG